MSMFCNRDVKNIFAGSSDGSKRAKPPKLFQGGEMLNLAGTAEAPRLTFSSVG
ncbi:hypothetical protein [Calothrix sp. PCC 6303]|uniref:hypothetical protein n=1 Tax=Calothrix sp. PCC 6303 TaxID=1170562 RepID=UPI0002A05401|nr:hypothetical protein Cal6303_4733 [Calothrix sp. PCC 6303]